MAAITWDATGERFYEAGVDQGVLYVMKDDGTYDNGVAWNGLTQVSEKPSGAEPTKLWADNINYVTMYSAEEFAATVEAYTYPDEFEECDGSVAIATGARITQQKRKTFGLSYRTKIGNDLDGLDKGYKLHIVYGAKAAPTEKAYGTINDSPEAITFSWELSTTPITASVTIDGVTKKYTTAHVEIDSRTADADKLKDLEDLLYGTDASGGAQGTEPTLPTLAQIISALS